MSETIQTFFGRAILPITVSIALLTLSSISLPGSKPGLSETYTSTMRPRMSSITGTAAASATSGTVSAADSISLVPSRCPATLITSSTRPRIRMYPSAVWTAPSLVKYGQSCQSLLSGFLLYFRK